MIVLGVNGGGKREEQHDTSGLFDHDAAAAILVDGQLVAAVEEERLNRIKHSNCFPVRAIQYCMDAARVKFDQIDRIAFNGDGRFLEAEGVRRCLMDSEYPVVHDAVGVVANFFERDFGVDVREKIRFCHHHYAHAWSAYALSGFPESLVLSLDGWGDDCCGMVFRARGRHMDALRKYFDSLGWMYGTMIRLLGFGSFDEYKAMGLAPYGDKETFASLFKKGYQLLPDGEYRFEPSAIWNNGVLEDGALHEHARRKGEKFTQIHMDVAAALQAALEEIVLHVLEYFARETKVPNLCLAGGVAHNCTLNGKILQSGMFERVFVQPAAHDAGGALGASLSVAFEEDSASQVYELLQVFLGPDIGSEIEVEQVLRCWSDLIWFEHLDNVTETTAGLLADGHVVGWIQGRSEFGPRALGNRSILADPRPSSNKDRINKMIKKRESFRPFAPAVTEERATEFFDIPRTQASLSFMTYALGVKEEVRQLLGAVTHVDGSARIQCVSRHSNEFFWRLLNRFGEITGIPILLNTSFNNNVEPIVQTVEDALACFLTTDLDELVVGSFLVRRLAASDAQQAIKRFLLSLPVHCRLEKVSQLHEGTRRVQGSFAITHVKERVFASTVLDGGPRSRQLSRHTFNVLLDCDGTSSVGELLNRVDVNLRPGVVAELMRLWTERLVCLAPPRESVDHVPA